MINEDRFPLGVDAEGNTRHLLPCDANSEDVTAYYNKQIEVREEKWKELKAQLTQAVGEILAIPRDSQIVYNDALVTSYKCVLTKMTELEEKYKW